jgi:hypothetical protein
MSGWPSQRGSGSRGSAAGVRFLHER